MTTKLKYPQVGAQTIKRGEKGPWGIEPSTKGRQQSLRRGDTPGQEGRPAGKFRPPPDCSGEANRTVRAGARGSTDSGMDGRVMKTALRFDDVNIADTNPNNYQFDMNDDGVGRKEMAGMQSVPLEKLSYPK